MSFLRRYGGPVAAIALAVIITFPSVSISAAWELLTGLRYNAGNNVSDITLADFDNDGIQDIIAINHNTKGSISYFAGTGMATFEKRLVHKLTHDPIAIDSADLNRDGNVDIVMANWDDSSISVMLGRGDKTFDDPVDSPNGSELGPIDFGIADFDKDGRLDIAVANLESASISVFYGDGAWTSPMVPVVFGLNPAYILGPAARGMTVGNFNGDEFMDIACSNWEAGAVHLLKNNGGNTAGAFEEVNRPLSVGNKPWGVEAADLNNDGVTDLTVCNTADDTFYVYLGKDGFDTFTTLAPTYSHRTYEGPSSLKLALVNNDRYLDLILPVALTGAAEVLMGRGDGQFDIYGTFSSGLYPASAAAGDFDNDLITDIAIGAFTSGLVTLMKGDIDLEGDWGFQPYTTVSCPSYSAGLDTFYMRTGDFNSDLMPDIIAADSGGGANLLAGDGHGALGAFSAYTTIVHLPTCSPEKDLNGDIRLDRVSFDHGDEVNPGTVTVEIQLPFSAYSTFGAYTTFGPYTVGVGPTCVHPVDMNNDRFPDLVVPNTVEGSYSVLLNNGFGMFQNATSFNTYAIGDLPRDMVFGDLNHDGYTDMALPNVNPSTAEDRVSVLLNGASGFSSVHHYGAESYIGGSPGQPLLFDIDHDSYLDMVVPNTADGTVTVLINNRSGVFVPHAVPVYKVGSAPVHVTACDLDMNGITDLAVANSGDNLIYVLLGQEKSTLSVTATAGGSTDAANGLYDTGTSFVITATPDPGYTFIGWKGDYTGKSNPLSVSLHGDKTITANFAVGPYVTSISPGDGIMYEPVTISGQNFGEKGKIRMIQGRKRKGVKPLTWSDSSITFLVPKNVPYGTNTVEIKSNDHDYPGYTSFEVRRATITGIAPASGVKDDVVTVTGTDFGSEKLKAYFYWTDGDIVRRKGAKVLSEPLPTNTTAQIVVPGVDPGDYTVVIKNKHGESTSWPFTVN